MSWTLKILADEFTNSKMVWNNNSFVKNSGSKKDYVINHHRDILSTWREVGYVLNKRNITIDKQSISNTLILNSTSAPYQFLEPLKEEVLVYLPKTPKEHTTYIIKNTSKTFNRSLIIMYPGESKPILKLKSPDKLIKLYFDSVDYHIQI